MGHIYFGASEVRTARQELKTGWDTLGEWGMECLVRGMLFGHPKGEKMFVSTAHTRDDYRECLGGRGLRVPCDPCARTT